MANKFDLKQFLYDLQEYAIRIALCSLTIYGIYVILKSLFNR